MKKALSLASAGLLVLTLTACGDSATDDTVDTGVYGIQAPTDVEHEERGEGFYQADLPEWDYEEAAEWMGDELPVGESIEGLNFVSEHSDDFGHDWCWASEPNESGEHDMLTVLVSSGNEDTDSPVTMMASTNTGDPVGCTS